MTRTTAALVLSWTMAACTGSIDDRSSGTEAPTGRTPAGANPDPGAPTPPESTAIVPLPPAAGAVAPLRLPLHMLTRDELDNTLRDLLFDDSRPMAASDKDREETNQAGFLDPRPLADAIDAGRLEDVFRGVADRAVKNALPRLATCAAMDDACADALIRGFGRRAFRRQLDADEVADLTSLVYRPVRALPGATFADAASALIQAMLLSPRFLYRWEIGSKGFAADGAFARLTGDQIASRLSYLLWSTMPDAELFRAADAGELATPDGIARQARRMLGDPKVKDGVGAFFVQWLGLLDVPYWPKDDKGTFKALLGTTAQSDRLRASMLQEVRAFVDDRVRSGGARAESFFTEPYTFVDAALAPIYGVPAPPSPQRVALDPARRSGLLTQPAFLMVNSGPVETSPTHRGKTVRMRLLCQAVPPPPPNVDNTPRPRQPGQTKRQQMADHASNPACSGCHRLMDYVGFGFEHYDAIGGWQDHDNGQPIDASGVLTAVTAAGVAGERPFDGAPGLMKAMVGTDDFSSCFAMSWLAYVEMLPAVPDPDPASPAGRTLAAVGQRFARSHDLVELLLDLVQSRVFTHRTIAAQEGTP